MVWAQDYVSIPANDGQGHMTCPAISCEREVRLSSNAVCESYWGCVSYVRNTSCTVGDLYNIYLLLFRECGSLIAYTLCTKLHVVHMVRYKWHCISKTISATLL